MAARLYCAGAARQRSPHRIATAAGAARHARPDRGRWRNDIHVSSLIVDGAIDDAGAYADDARAKRLRPEDIASEAFHLVSQDRSAWTFELDLRPLHEPW